MGAFQGEAIQRAARLGDGLQGGGPSRRKGDPPADADELQARGLCLCGTPDQIEAAIRAAHEQAPFERHRFWAILPGVEPTVATRSIELFAREVIPRLRDL